MSRIPPLLLLAASVGGCAGMDPGRPSGPGGKADGGGGATEILVGGDRPARLLAPTGDDGVTPRPLLVALHGVTEDAERIDSWLGLSEYAAREGYFLLLPDGTIEPWSGARFWNAVDGCCDFGETGVDDAGYLRDLIDEAVATVAVDPDRIYVLGHSNGGYMAHRLGCDLADRLAAVVVLAGGQWTDESRCAPARPLSVIQIHATSDAYVLYAEGERAVALWSRLDGCDGAVEGAPLDLLRDAPGAETRPMTATCEEGTEVALYRMETGPEEDLLTDRFHEGAWNPEFLPTVFGWLAAHTR